MEVLGCHQINQSIGSIGLVNNIISNQCAKIQRFRDLEFLRNYGRPDVNDIPRDSPAQSPVMRRNQKNLI
jgi:hypothetical protein